MSTDSYTFLHRAPKLLTIISIFSWHVNNKYKIIINVTELLIFTTNSPPWIACKIHISSATHNLLASYFSTTLRGNISIKVGFESTLLSLYSVCECVCVCVCVYVCACICARMYMLRVCMCICEGIWIKRFILY